MTVNLGVACVLGFHRQRANADVGAQLGIWSILV